MAVISRDLGPVTAYAAAVNRGYTGTREEFETLMASYATVAEQAGESASAAADSASDAESSASAAATSASDASSFASAANTSASNASNAATAAGIAQTAAESAKDAAQSAQTAAEAAQAGAEAAVDGFDDTVTAAISDVNAAGTNQKELAKRQAEKSEAWAVGKINGEDVGVSDPAYHNNAKYYAESAGTSATTATTKAGEAAQSAANASASASAAAASAQSLVIDETLSVEGRAADAKATGDAIDDLKEDIDNIYVSPFARSNSEMAGVIGFKPLGTEISYGYRVRYFGFKNSSYYFYMQIQYKTEEATDTWATYTNIEIANAPANENGIIALGNAKASIYLIPALMQTVNTHQLSPAVPIIPNTNSFLYNTIDNAFALSDMVTNVENALSDRVTNVENPIFDGNVPSALNGIVQIWLTQGGNFDITSYTKYRLQNFYFDYNGQNWLFGTLQGYNGTTWVYVDEVKVPSSPAPTVTNLMVLKGKYRIINMVIVPSLMGTIQKLNLNLEIKKYVIDAVAYDQQNQLNNLISIDQLPDFAYKDYAKNIITVDASGNGDYTTIGAAYAAITDSSFENQYIVAIYPGTYNEYDLKPPKFTHTTGLNPDTVVVTGVGISQKEKSIFDLYYTGCKLSNMTIIANGSMSNPDTDQNRYCVHFDSGIAQRYAICENLKLIKVYDATTNNPNGINVRNRAYNSAWSRYVVGMGAQGQTNKIVFRDCTFVNGVVFSHTQPNNTENTVARFELDGCQFVNSYIELSTLGSTYNTNGSYICKIDNCKFDFANNKKNLKYVYQNGHHAWTITGSNNKNLTIDFAPNDSSTDEAWECIKTDDVREVYITPGVAVTKGQWVDAYGYLAHNTQPVVLVGCVLEDKATDALTPVKVWCGNAYPVDLANGEYGVASGTLSSGEQYIKIGYVRNKILYRY